MREACAQHDLALVAYSPIAKGRVRKDEVLARIGRAHGKSAAQVCLRWLVQQKVSAIPRTSRLERLSENIEVFDFELSAAEMTEISAMSGARRTADRFRFLTEMGLRLCRVRLYAGGWGACQRSKNRWNRTEPYARASTASAIAHLSILALLVLLSEVHPLGSATEPIAVDIVTPQEVELETPAGTAEADKFPSRRRRRQDKPEPQPTLPDPSALTQQPSAAAAPRHPQRRSGQRSAAAAKAPTATG